MSKAEITATEKLLNLIREDATEPEALSEAPVAAEDSINTISLTMEPVTDSEIDQTAPEPAPTSVPPDNPPPEETAAPAPPPQNNSDQHHTEPNILNAAQEPAGGLWHRLIAHSGSVKVGIDIQPACINLVKFSRAASANKFTRCQTVSFKTPLERDINSLPDDIEFKTTLARTLRNFCGDDKKPEIWCSISGLKIGLHNIIIPKVKESEIANAVFWSTKKSVDFDPKQDIFDFDIVKELEDHGTTRILTLVTLVSRSDINILKNIFADTGFALTGISYPPAATLNLLLPAMATDVAASHEVTAQAESSAIVHLRIRENNSFIDIFSNNRMLFSREIKTDTKSFIESCQEYGNNAGINIDDQTAASLIFLNHNAGISSDCKEIRHKINPAELAVLDRLTRQLNRTFEYCANHFKIPRIETIWTSGEFILRKSILLEIQNKLGINCKILPALGTANNLANLHSRRGMKIPPSCKDLYTAAGLALAVPGQTKNFLYTYTDRQRDQIIKKINQAISIVTIVAALLGGGLVFQQYHKVSLKKAEVRQLTQQLQSRYQKEPHSKDSTWAQKGIQKLSAENIAVQKRISRFQILAGLSELNAIMPKDIKLTSLLITKSNNKKKKKKKTAVKNKALWLKGYVSGKTARQDFVLLNFIKELSTLKLAQHPVLINKKQVAEGKRSITQFTVRLTTNFVNPSKKL